jgi:hypothetical protein
MSAIAGTKVQACFTALLVQKFKLALLLHCLKLYLARVHGVDERDSWYKSSSVLYCFTSTKAQIVSQTWREYKAWMSAIAGTKIQACFTALLVQKFKRALPGASTRRG